MMTIVRSIILKMKFTLNISIAKEWVVRSFVSVKAVMKL